MKKAAIILLPVFCLLIGVALGSALKPSPVSGDDLFCASLNATYLLDDRPIDMEDGYNLFEFSNQEVPPLETEIHRLPLIGETEPDKKGAVVILEQLIGGGGVLYYLSVCGLTDGEAVTVPGVLLGDRVHVLSVTLSEYRIWVTLLARKQDDSFDAPPTIYQTKVFEIQNGSLKTVMES